MDTTTQRYEERPTTADSPIVTPLMRDFLAWVARHPRSYVETMEAWRSSCPRFTIWEDALADQLVVVESAGSTIRDAAVVLTPRGHVLLRLNNL